MSSSTRRGRPPDSVKKRFQGFYIEDNLIKQLDMDSSKSKSRIVNDALQLYFSGRSVSDYYHKKRLDEIRKEENQILSLLQMNEDERLKIQEKENTIKQEYERLCDYLNNPTDVYNTVRFNNEYNLNISGFPEFEKLREECINGDFTFERYKTLKKGVNE